VEASLPVVFDLIRGLLNDTSAPIRAETRLISTGLLDSYGVLELVERLETRFHFTALRADLTPENLETPAQILAWIQRKQGAA
jgi:acyl carrier protein